MFRFLALIACLTLLSTAPAHARTEGGDPLWQDEFGVVEMSASDGLVAAVGTIINPNGGATSVVRVYDADKKGLLWQEAVAADSVILDGDRVVVAGGTSVRAYDAKKGRLQWSDVAPFAISQLYRDEDTTIATAVTAAGTLRVRVYDTKRGTVLVRDQALPLQGATAFAAGKMFIANSVRVPFEGFSVALCRVTAYSLATGAQLWLTIQPFPAPVPTTSRCNVFTVTADQKRVILGGAGHFGDEFMAQAYDAKTGAFLWEHLSFIGNCCIDAVVAIDIERRLVFVAGWTRNIFYETIDQDFVIRALHADTGALQWEGRTPGLACPAPPVHCQVHAKLVLADSGTVYGAGFQGEDGRSKPGTGFLRAYDASSGRFQWEQPVDVEAIAATRGTVLVLTPGTNADDVILRAYDGK